MKSLRRVAGVIVLAVLVITAGCPEKQEPELAVDQASLSIDPEGDGGTITIRNGGGGDLEWSIDADVDWITFTQNEGTGDAVVNAVINRDDLRALSTNNATITITSSGGTVQIPVVVASPVAGLDPAYMPFAKGNIWRLTMRSN
ncbi:MAG: BACON domain-containing protein [Candidatus Hydrogenedentes bacterium]|nr:BACON domain-containing protein [Candidatus Hydrogenedentota bacterium]